MAPMRRSQGSIRSLHVKRNVQSQVTFEDWLFKFEGGALRQWKQRWCVLVDFCLFFYKAPKEEKVLSSILLPSYKINPCSAGDKVSKKYAFKAEHQNMKTFYFAAENKEGMQMWMNVMSLATIMQNSRPAICDDEDSGFPLCGSHCYRSRRLNCVHNRDSSCEQLKQRSSSCGDRVGEMCLRNDDKYPNLYKSMSSQLCMTLQDVPVKQPLYANAPPKPKRLTQADGFGIDSFKNREGNLYGSEAVFMDVNEHFQSKNYENRSNSTQLPPLEAAGISPYLANDLILCNKMKAARPRSANFLERESELPLCSSQYFETQRPKSSLECYDQVTDCEDYDFDNYREAVRIQADNFYANKIFLKSRNLHDRQTKMMVDGQPNSTCEYRNSIYFPQHLRNQLILCSKKSVPNESMQRLFEWKQRMLLSPLSRRNQPPLDISSTKQMDPTPRNYEACKTVPYPSENNILLNKLPSNVCARAYQNKYETTKENDEIANNFQKNIMYCVDSENNEILFSYDTSPIDLNSQANFQNSHYPPQMHSFSTLSNINDVGIETVPVVEYNAHMQNENVIYETSCGRQDSSSVANEKQSTYSSDDEASADSDKKHRAIAGNVSSGIFCSTASCLDLSTREAMNLKRLVQKSHGLMCQGKQLSVSAGDLLGKTHEELVLLLIQLRRNQSKILKASEKLERKIKKKKDGVYQMKREHYEKLYNQIIDLEKQYEMTQPLVTLVENMVKLGSLYGNSNCRSFSLPILDLSQTVPSSPNSSESLHQINISKLLKEENSLQKHVRKLNKLERRVQNETNCMSTLYQDKEMLEHTLFGMRNKILDHQDRPAELQKLHEQQKMIEKELIRVKRLLSSSAKKIEDATFKNDQMEQEILHLRQILQQALNTGSAEMKASQHNREELEAELTRLQSVLDELANHRHEINNTVEKLKSEVPASKSKINEVRASPTGVAGSAALPLRKKHHCMYLETDLDTMRTRDLAILSEKDGDDIPVYANAEEITLTCEEASICDDVVSNTDILPSSSKIDQDFCSLQDINEADERMKRFYGILPKDKPSEIKTVRIVKRQSERRNRERDKKKVSYDEQSSVWVMEEPDLSSDDCLEIEGKNSKKIPISEVNRPFSINLSSASSRRSVNVQSAHELLFGSIMSSERQVHAQNRKKSKRRHYTVSGYQYMLDPQFAQYFTEKPRSRDDVDMERCLRTANTPDIVRSTIKKNDVFDDKLIDRELGLPQKIDIPERYVEIEPENLSATEKLQRSLKAEYICKMLSETTTPYEDVENRSNSPDTLHKKLSEEKRKRAHLLSLNQALAREVVEKSKAVATNVYPLENQAAS